MNAVSKNLTVFFIFIIMFAIQNSMQDFLQTIDKKTATGLYLPFLVYLPHGVRIISLITYGNIIIPGLFFASLTTFALRMESMDVFLNYEFNYIADFGSPFVSIFAVWLAIFLIAKKIKISEDQITVPLVLKITFLSALFNAIFANVFRFIFTENYQNLDSNILLYFIGDSIGALILFSFFALINRSLKD